MGIGTAACKDERPSFARRWETATGAAASKGGAAHWDTRCASVGSGA
jgi:hypothetical protein